MLKNLLTTEPIVPLLIVDDHKMVRDGLKLMLGSFKNSICFIVEEAETGEEAIKKIGRKDFQLVIMDYQMPGLSGAEAIIRMLRFKPDLKILGLSNHDELVYVQSMIDAGAKGYVLKNIEPAQLLTAIKTVLQNGIYYSNEVAMKMIEGFEKKTVKTLWNKEGLTRREIEILKMIAMEMTNEKIAEKLSIGKRTVDSHRQNLLNKLHATNTVGLIKAAYKMKLIS